MIWKMVSSSFLCFSSLVSLSKCFLFSFNPLSMNVSLNALKILSWGFTIFFNIYMYIQIYLIMERHETNWGT